MGVPSARTDTGRGDARPHARSFLSYLVIVFLLLTVQGVIFRLLFVLVNHSDFHSVGLRRGAYALLWGLRFDLAAAAIYTTVIGLIYYPIIRISRATTLRSYAVLGGAIALLVSQVGDLVYYREAGRHVGYEIRDLMHALGGSLHTLITSYPLSIAAVVGCSVMLIAAFGRHRFVIRTGGFSPELSLLGWLVLAVVFTRGDLKDVPMDPSRAYAIGDETLADIAHNAGYAITYYLYKGDIARPAYQEMSRLPEVEERKLLGIGAPAAEQQFAPPTQLGNVIILALESWPAHRMASFNPDADPTTPEFDAIRRRSLTTDGMLTSAHRTVEGVFDILCSWPNPLGDAITGNQLFGLDYRCLPEILKEAGWSTAVFQGMNRGKTGALAQKLGIERSYGKKDIGRTTRVANGWGVDDIDLYHFVLEHLRMEQTPFFYLINTTTTHDVTLPPGEPFVFGDDSDVSRRKSVLHYADWALGRFFDELDRQVQGPTLVVLTADHTAGPLPSQFDRHFVPFALLALATEFYPAHLPGLASHRDIAPTVLDWLGGHAPWFSGTSLLSYAGAGLEADYFAQGIQVWVRGPRLVQFPIVKPTRIQCYSWPGNHSLESPRPCDGEDRAIGNKARAFVGYSQELLFSGRTARYGLPSRPGR